MKSNRHIPWLGLAVATGAVAGLWHRARARASAPEPTPVAPPTALLTPSAQTALAEALQAVTPPGAMALVLHDDRGALARRLAPGCRMVFCADGDGAAARRRAEGNLIPAAVDLSRLWLAEDSLDMAVLVNVLQRQADPAVLLGQLTRVLKPGGLLALPTTVRPDAFTPSAWAGAMELLGLADRQCWTQPALCDWLQAQGWTVESAQQLDSGFPLALLLCRRAEP